MLKVKVNKTFPRRPFKLMKGPHWSRYQHFEISCPLLLYLLLALFGLSSGTWSWCHRKVTRSFAQQATTEQILSMDSISKVLLKFRMVRTIKISQYQLYYYIFKITFCFVGFFFLLINGKNSGEAHSLPKAWGTNPPGYLRGWQMTCYMYAKSYCRIPSWDLVLGYQSLGFVSLSRARLQWGISLLTASKEIFLFKLIFNLISFNLLNSALVGK